MLERIHLTKEEWDDLEPLLRQAEEHAHEEYFSQEAPPGLLPDAETTPGCLLLRRLISRGDEQAIVLFRAAEMYFHELARHGYATAYLRGKERGGEGTGRAAG